MRYLLTILLLLCFTGTAFGHRYLEHQYRDHWCMDVEGDPEYVLPDRARVDCLTDEYAIEVDFAYKWAEAIGQASMYAIATGRNPGVLLIMEDPERDYKYLLRLLVGIAGSNRQWSVWIISLEDLSYLDNIY